MFRDLRTLRYILILVSLAIIAGSCSGGDFVISPEFGLQSGTQRMANKATHQCWGLYDIFISADHTQWDVVPRRQGMSHVNLVPLLEGNKNYLTIPEGGVVFEPEYIAATVQIQHPLVSIPGVFDASFFTGFDVKGIVMFPGTKEFPETGIVTQDIIGDKDGRVLNPEGYTRWWNPVEFADGAFLEAYVEGKMGLFPGDSHLINATVNPYRWIYPGQHRHSFKPESGPPLPQPLVAQTTYHILLPALGEPFALMYAVDASYELPTVYRPPGGPEPTYVLADFEMTSNQPEPYDMIITATKNTMWADGLYEGSGGVMLDIDVYDWQDPRFFKTTPDEDTGVRKPFMEAPDLFDGIIKFAPADFNPNASAHATTIDQISTGLMPEGFLIINGVKAEYDKTKADNTSYENAEDIADDLNDFLVQTEVLFTAVNTAGKGTFFVEHKFGGPYNRIKIENTPNLAWLGLDTLDNAELFTPDDGPSYYLVDNGVACQGWKGEFENTKTILPGKYQVLIGCPDYAEDPLFPSVDQYPTTYWMVTLDVEETIPYLCDDHQGTHSNYLGTTVVTNGLAEYHADCDFIGYPGSAHYGKLLFNIGTALPGGPQEIGVVDADSQGILTALTIITIDDDKKGIPLILQEDEVSGNIIVVNHIFQDNILVFNAAGEFLNSFDHYGNGDDGLNSPVALEFDEDGDMWLVSHRGSTGAELRHWVWDGGGNYINAPGDLVDLAPIFGTGYNIIDLEISPVQGYIYVFSNINNGQYEVFDYTQSPPALVEEQGMDFIFSSPIVPVNYPGLRICGGGEMIIDRFETELETCRILAAANLTAGPLAIQKIDSFSNLLDLSLLPLSKGALCMAMNNDPNAGLRNIVVFPIQMANNFTLYGPPVDW